MYSLIKIHQSMTLKLQFQFLKSFNFTLLVQNKKIYSYFFYFFLTFIIVIVFKIHVIIFFHTDIVKSVRRNEKEKKNIMNIFFTINRLISAESWCSERERWSFIKLKLKVIMIYLTVFNVIVDVIKKKENFKDKS